MKIRKNNLLQIAIIIIYIKLKRTGRLVDIINASPQCTLTLLQFKIFLLKIYRDGIQNKTNTILHLNFLRNPSFKKALCTASSTLLQIFFLCFHYNWYKCILKLLWVLLFKLVLVLAFHFQILTKGTTPTLPTQSVRTDSLINCFRNWPRLATNLNTFSLLLTSKLEISCLKKGRKNFKLPHGSKQSLSD